MLERDAAVASSVAQIEAQKHAEAAVALAALASQKDAAHASAVSALTTSWAALMQDRVEMVFEDWRAHAGRAEEAANYLLHSEVALVRCVWGRACDGLCVLRGWVASWCSCGVAVMFLWPEVVLWRSCGAPVA